MANRRIQPGKAAPWVTVGGVVLLLVGLAWDAILHSLDETLAAREGIFSLSNPGHVLSMAGVALTAAGAVLFLLERTLTARAMRPLAGAGALGLTVLAAAAFAIALSSGTGVGGVIHEHEDGAVHTHEEHQAFLAQQQGGAAGATGVKKATSDARGIVHDHGESIAISAAELLAAAQLVAEVQSGTERLQDFAAAQAEGYIQITRGQSGLAHYINPRYMADGKIADPARPESLMYLRLPSGEMRLVGVMFLMPPGQPGPRIGGVLTAWHAHDNLCYSNATGVITALTNAQGQCPAGTSYRGVTPEMMHVWLVDNPNGVFGEEMDPKLLIAQLTATSSR